MGTKPSLGRQKEPMLLSGRVLEPQQNTLAFELFRDVFSGLCWALSQLSESSTKRTEESQSQCLLLVPPNVISPCLVSRVSSPLSWRRAHACSRLRTCVPPFIIHFRRFPVQDWIEYLSTKGRYCHRCLLWFIAPFFSPDVYRCHPTTKPLSLRLSSPLFLTMLPL